MLSSQITDEVKLVAQPVGRRIPLANPLSMLVEHANDVLR
jgi:hypothetical protein